MNGGEERKKKWVVGGEGRRWMERKQHASERRYLSSFRTVTWCAVHAAMLVCRDRSRIHTPVRWPAQVIPDKSRKLLPSSLTHSNTFLCSNVRANKRQKPRAVSADQISALGRGGVYCKQSPVRVLRKCDKVFRTVHSLTGSLDS